MSSKPVKFFSPPSILIKMAIPNSKVKEATRKLRQMTYKMGLKGEIKEKRPDENFPGATFFAIMISPGYKIDSAEKLVKASHDVTGFQALFQTAVFSQNSVDNIL